MSFDQLADRILAGGAATEADAVAVLQAPDSELMSIVAAAGRLRREHFGNTVKVNYLVNLKSGLCPENCNYCSQALGSQAPILKYSWLSKDETLKQAGAGLRGGATRVCMVSSGRGPSNRDIDKVVEGTDCSDLDFEHDVKPWLGNRAGFGAVDVGEDDPAPVIALQVSDGGKARTGIQRIADCAGLEPLGFVIGDDYALLSDSTAHARTIQADAKKHPLADDASYRTWTDRAGSRGL